MKEETKAAVMVYEARDGVEITLTFDVIRRYLVQGHPEFVVPSEFMYFMGVCKSQGMNPFKKDCYLIKYTQKDSAAIIVAIDFLRSRAKAQSDCKGWNAGIILQKDNVVEFREGTLILEDEKLVGGWFEGKPAAWDKPIKWSVPLKTYLKKTREGNLTRFWETDNQPGQIAKVAESQGLKKCWPQEFQNLYTNAEIAPDDGIKGLPEIPEETGEEVDAEFDADAHEDFDKKVPKDAKPDRVKEFLGLVQRGAEKTTFEVKQEAFDHWDDFWASFVKWQGKKYGSEQTESTDNEDKVRMKLEPEDLSLYDELKNVRSSSLEARVREHYVRISHTSQKFQDWLKNVKWKNVYKGAKPYPLDKAEDAATEHVAPSGEDSEDNIEIAQPGAEEGIVDDESNWIDCSHKEIAADRIKVTYCEGGCRKRENENGEIICKDYMAYLEKQKKD